MLHPDFADHLAVLDARWAHALEATGFEAAAVDAGVPAGYFLDDQSAPFRANPHFAQWFPYPDSAHSALLIRPGQRPRLYFYQPVDYWHQPPVVPPWADAHLDVQCFADPDELQRELAQATARCNRVAYLGACPPAGFATAAAAVANPPSLLDQLHYDRACKTDFELDCMAEATRRAVRGHVAARRAFAEGASEFATHLRYLEASQQTSEELPYPSIVAQNQHAGVLHYQHYDREPAQPLRSFLIDAGARHLGYAADITRTYAAATTQAQPFAALIGDLDALQRALVDELRPGLDYVRLHEIAHQRIAGVLVRHGLLRCTPEAAFETGLTRTFLPHGLGHLLGLQTHDVGGLQQSREGARRLPPDEYPALRLTRELAPRQALTIEPGIYFIPQLLDAAAAGDHGALVDWDRVAQLRPFGGIRIEDNVIITENGATNLTRDAFRAMEPG